VNMLKSLGQTMLRHGLVMFGLLLAFSESAV
jgi:hypothetical protein